MALGGLLATGETSSLCAQTQKPTKRITSKQNAPKASKVQDSSTQSESGESTLAEKSVVLPVGVGGDWLRNAPKFSAAISSMAKGMPEVAVKNFRELLKTEGIPKEALPVIYRYLGEALVRAHLWDEALEVLTTPELTQGYEPIDEIILWRSLTEKGTGYYTRALRGLESLESSDALSADDKAIACGQSAQILGLLGRNDEAASYWTRMEQRAQDPFVKSIALLAGADLEIKLGHFDRARALLDSLKKDASAPGSTDPSVMRLVEFLGIELLIAEGNLDDALTKCKSMNETKENQALPPLFQDLLKLLTARAEIADETIHPERYADKEKGKGEDRLLAFIDASPDSPFLMQVFSQLKEGKAFQTSEASKKLEDWAMSMGEQTKRTSLAFYFYIQELIEKDDTVKIVEAAKAKASKAKDSAIVFDAEVSVLRYLGERKRWNDVTQIVNLLPKNEARTDFAQASMLYGEGKFDEAAEVYKKAFDSFEKEGSIHRRETAFNVALASLQAGRKDLYRAMLESPSIDDTLREDIRLEEALLAATKREVSAVAKLRDFIDNHPGHPREAEALLTLGELAISLEPPNEGEAVKSLARLKEMTLSPEDRDRYLRLQIILPESAGQWTTAIESTRDYLRIIDEERRDNSTAQAMRLKLGELLYRNGDFSQARLYLLNLTKQLPKDSPFIPSALFIAAKAAQNLNTKDSLEEALSLFQEVSASPSDYKIPATIESASILLRQGREEQAIRILEPLVSLTDKFDPETRRLALALQAEAYGLMSIKDKNLLSKAIELTTSILEEPGLPSSWRYRVLFQRARLNEQAQDVNAALKDYNDMISRRSDNILQYEWHWYYQAGFAMMRLLEATKKWDAAVRVADTLAKSGGPRADEAAKRAKKIRLEHFIWDGETEEKEHF